VKIITGFTPGGTSDTICRRVAAKLHRATARAWWSRTAPVPAASWRSRHAQLPPDGSTLLQTPMSMLGIYPHIYKKLPYDPVNDLTPVSLGCTFDFGFAVGPAVPAR
jgi:tripartite-type tricarboxylate transporter receptor subunit TctC